MMKKETMIKRKILQTVIFSMILAAVFVLLIRLVWPENCFYGSITDWYNQHVALAETIRKVCIQEKTLAPSWISIGGGSNGFQFAYYGYYRPDIIIGCLLPDVPMTVLIPVYALGCYLASVLLLQIWLRMQGMTPYVAFFGSMLFLLSGCFFQTHRQIMFVNYMPFLLLALIFLKKRRFALMSISLTLIYLHSFYYAIACLAVIGWFAVGMLNREDRSGRRRLLFQGVTSVILSLGMAMMLLLPTFLTILEHRHSGEEATTLADLVVPNIRNLLYDPYGLGLTLLCLYLLMLGLRLREVRWQCVLLLAGSLFGVAPYVLNATLYARGKILMPFVLVVIYYCMKVFQKIRQGETQWHLWPFLVFAIVMLTQRKQQWFTWVALDSAVLFVVVLVDLLMRKYGHLTDEEEERQSLYGRGIFRYLALFVMPFFIYVGAAANEGWQKIPGTESSQRTQTDIARIFDVNIHSASETEKNQNPTTEHVRTAATAQMSDEDFTEEELQAICGNKLYRCDKLTDTKKECNTLQFYGQQTATMYSSVTNPMYQNFYYNVVKMPVQINNRTALLAERNPLFAQLMGERYILTTEHKIPSGYSILQQKGRYVIAENTNVLPIAYTTADCISNQQFEGLDDQEKMTALSRYTVVENKKQETVSVSDMKEISLPGLDAEEVSHEEQIQITSVKNGYRITAPEAGVIRIPLDPDMKNGTLYFRFQVTNHTEDPVIISANGRKNKLSGEQAPYPNENYIFSYMLKEKGRNKYISLKVSAGTYDLTDMECYRFPTRLFQEKQVQSAELLPQDQWKQNSVLSCKITAGENGYFVTSIPMQNGLKLYIDGKETNLETVNTAFAGAKVTAGTHTVDLQFDPPGQKYGKLASLLCVLLYAVWVAATVWKKQHK